MRDFLSEYGFAILAAIVVIILIMLITPIGDLIKNQIMGVIDSFANKTEQKISSVSLNERVTVNLKQKDKKGRFEIVAKSDSTSDIFESEYRVKDQFNNWGNWIKISGQLSSENKKHKIDFTASIENGNYIQVRVKDVGVDDEQYFESEIIEYTGSSSVGSASGMISWEEGITPVTTVKDLTGYTWTAETTLYFQELDIINDEYKYEDADGIYYNRKLSYDINFNCDYEGYGDVLFDTLSIDYILRYQPDKIQAYGDCRYSVLGNNKVIYSGMFSGEDSWSSTEAKTFNFIGGEDSTNPYLIAWLEANGTLNK